MAFLFRVIDVEYEDSPWPETVLTGILETGELRGGETIRIPTRSGAIFESRITSMEGPGPSLPPVRAETIGDAQLFVGVGGHPPERDIPVPCVAEGELGRPGPELPPVVRPRSEWLRNPLFWTMWYYLLTETEEVEAREFIQPFFGCSADEVDAYYVREWSVDGARPPIRIELPFPGHISLGIEFTDGEERYTLRSPRWSGPANLGYNSGHFALPALRWEEVSQFPACLQAAGMSARDAQAGLLLFLPGVYLPEELDLAAVERTVTEAWRQFGMGQPDRLEELSHQIADNLHCEVNWWQDPELGWINDGQYSLRNPKTLMSGFDPARFHRIAEFMRAVSQ